MCQNNLFHIFYSNNFIRIKICFHLHEESHLLCRSSWAAQWSSGTTEILSEAECCQEPRYERVTSNVGYVVLTAPNAL